MEELARSETGFQTAAEITAILLKEARPHLLLVNGTSALANFHALYRTRLAEWHKQAYASASSGRKLWHCQGILRGLGHDLPIVGFPFLRTPRTHNSHAKSTSSASLGESSSVLYLNRVSHEERCPVYLLRKVMAFGLTAPLIFGRKSPNGGIHESTSRAGMCRKICKHARQTSLPSPAE